MEMSVRKVIYIPLSARQSVEPRYEIQPDDLAEIEQREAGGWQFIHAEDNLTDIGKRTGVVDVAEQCAFGNVDKVLMADLDAICRATREAVRLRLYFVERAQYERCRKERKRLSVTR